VRELTLCSSIVGTLTSRFSLYAALLSWARTGGESVQRTLFVDLDVVSSGAVECGWLQQTYKPKALNVPSTRWLASTAAWVSGLMLDIQEHSNWEGKVIMMMRGFESEPLAVPIMSLEALLPTLPRELLWPEAYRLGGVGRFAVSGSGASRIWNLECPVQNIDYDLVTLPGGSDPTLAGVLLEAGVQHAVVGHIGQAARCFRAAVAASETRHDVSPEVHAKLIADVAYSVDLLESKYLAPYHFWSASGYATLSALVRVTFPYGSDPESILQVPL
jgi:hypothetical protein